MCSVHDTNKLMHFADLVMKGWDSGGVPPPPHFYF